MTARKALLATAAATVIGAAGLAIAVPAASAAEGDTILYSCQGKKTVKPKEIVLACGDGNTYVYKIEWKSWGMNSARGTGVLNWNTCLPQTCSDGIVQEYKVNIRLGRVASGPGVDAFSRMTLTFPDGGPAMLDSGFYTMDFGPQ